MLAVEYVQPIDEIKSTSNYENGYIGLEKLLSRNSKSIIVEHFNSIMDSIKKENVLQDKCIELNYYVNNLECELLRNYDPANNGYMDLICNGDEIMNEHKYSKGKLKLISMLACCNDDEIEIYDVKSNKKDFNSKNKLHFHSSVEEKILENRYEERL